MQASVLSKVPYVELKQVAHDDLQYPDWDLHVASSSATPKYSVALAPAFRTACWLRSLCLPKLSRHTA